MFIDGKMRYSQILPKEQVWQMFEKLIYRWTWRLSLCDDENFSTVITSTDCESQKRIEGRGIDRPCWQLRGDPCWASGVISSTPHSHQESRDSMPVISRDFSEFSDKWFHSLFGIETVIGSSHPVTKERPELVQTIPPVHTSYWILSIPVKEIVRTAA